MIEQYGERVLGWSEYIESAARHHVLCGFDEKGPMGMSGVMRRHMEGMIYSSDGVCSEFLRRLGSMLLDEAEFCVLERYRFGGL